MKKIGCFVIFCIIGFLSTCATLNKSTINSLHREKLIGPFLQPDFELYDLRIDLIRNTTTEEVNDSTETEKEMPYHRLGFNLGNGLYYDLNENLCLRLTDLFNIDDLSDF